MTWSPDHHPNPNPNRLTGRQLSQNWLTLTHIIIFLTISAINLVHVNGRSLYIVDWRMVAVERGNVLHHVKRRVNCPGGENVRGIMSAGICPGEMLLSTSQRQYAAAGCSVHCMVGIEDMDRFHPYLSWHLNHYILIISHWHGRRGIVFAMLFVCNVLMLFLFLTMFVCVSNIPSKQLSYGHETFRIYR